MKASRFTTTHRHLKAGETVRETDEVLVGYPGEWEPVVERAGNVVEDPTNPVYRRKITID